jgi:hypothetical protein
VEGTAGYDAREWGNERSDSRSDLSGEDVIEVGGKTRSPLSDQLVVDPGGRQECRSEDPLGREGERISKLSLERGELRVASSEQKDRVR